MTNFPAINWTTLTVDSVSNRQEHIRFLHILRYHQLTQIVHEPNRGKHILDLILTNHPEHSDIYVLEEISDHKIVHCSLLFPWKGKARIVKLISNYARADDEKMNLLLKHFRHDFLANLQNRTTDEHWRLFRDKLKEIEDSCVPKRMTSPRPNDPWFTGDLKRQ